MMKGIPGLITTDFYVAGGNTIHRRNEIFFYGRETTAIAQMQLLRRKKARHLATLRESQTLPTFFF
jgi:hypothetical protein